MPKPVRGGQRYIPGLDGLRAVAVIAVVAYHLQLPFAQGGLLGVGVFFTLSGYLITDLLLGQHAASGRLELAGFWLRRARRLLPALFVMLAVVAVWVSTLDRAQLPGLRPAMAAAAGYVSNWWLIAQHSSYFARFGPPSALGHLWSLAVEEQFYLVWPWLLLLGLRLARGRAGRYWLAAATLALAAASAIEMALLYHPGYDPTRVYDGTDTRAFALMIGAALAFVWPSRLLRADIGSRSRWLLDCGGAAGLILILLLVWRSGQYSPFLYPDGMVLLSVGTAAVVAASASPASRIGRVLGWRPLRWLGVRSYGIYLWHYPIIVLTTPANGGESLARGAAQLAASITAAALSWRFVEEPVRHGAIGRLWARLRRGGWRAVSGQAQAAFGVTAAVAVVAGCGLAGAVPAASSGTPTASTSILPAAPASQTVDGAAPSGQGSPLPTPGGPTPGRQGPAATSAASAPRSRLLTSCRSVVHIGDSTSDGLVLPAYQPDAALRIAAQYRRVGVTTFIPEVSGARSIVETWHGFPNAYTVAEQLIEQGYHGCWVLALGTNDAADVAVGSNVGLAARVQRMMSLIGDQPVMWVNVISLLASGPYSNSNMQQWNQALRQACPRYPNMRVYDWAAVAQPSWFIPDGIHYTPYGYAQRARLIADALAHAFPLSQPGLPQVAPPERILPLGVTDGAVSSHASCLVH
jgi:peptidoglycan/LPS O-acetylase OafA/YrhL/lysophospholipase L1-like esterase